VAAAERDRRRHRTGGGGVIRDPEIHKQVLLDVLHYAKAEGFGLLGLVKSSLLGPKGNTEFLVWLNMKPNDVLAEDLVNGIFLAGEMDKNDELSKV